MTKRCFDYRFFGIPSTQRNQLLITQYYVGLFGRSPDISGLNYWMSQLDAQQSNKLAVITEMMKSPECGGDGFAWQGALIGPTDPDAIAKTLAMVQQNLQGGWSLSKPGELLRDPRGLNVAVSEFIESFLAATPQSQNAINENRVSAALLANEQGMRLDLYYMYTVTADEATIAPALTHAHV